MTAHGDWQTACAQTHTHSSFVVGHRLPPLETQAFQSGSLANVVPGPGGDWAVHFNLLGAGHTPEFMHTGHAEALIHFGFGDKPQLPVTSCSKMSQMPPPAPVN